MCYSALIKEYKSSNFSQYKIHNRKVKVRSQNLGIIRVFTWRSLYSLPWRSHSVWDPWADAQGTFQAWLAEEITSILFARAQSLEEHRLLVQTWEGLLLTAALPCLLPLMLLPSTVSWSWSSCWRSPGLREGRVLTNIFFSMLGRNCPQNDLLSSCARS